MKSLILSCLIVAIYVNAQLDPSSDSFVAVPSFGKCPEGTQLSEQECKNLGDGRGFSSWGQAGTWSLPETCGCFIDSFGTRYFNRLTGKCDSPDLGELMICKPIQNDLYEVVPSDGKCPQGTKLSEQECKDLGNGRGFSNWGGAGTWGLPETCGCFIDQDGSRYFNRLTGACDSPDSTEHMICKKPTQEPSQEPTGSPSFSPTHEPSQEPTGGPSFSPTHEPTQESTSTYSTTSVSGIDCGDENLLVLETVHECQEAAQELFGKSVDREVTNGNCGWGFVGCVVRNDGEVQYEHNLDRFDTNCQWRTDRRAICKVRETPVTSPHGQLKAAVKAAFDSIKSPENKVALPGLIRKAFHDAGHFDQASGDVRMGCIQHFLGHPDCKQHDNLGHAENVVKAVMNQIPSDMVLSMADAVQLLGALAVDELAQGTGAAPLYDRVRTGRLDPTAETCIDDIGMCNNLPAFFTRRHFVKDHEDIVMSLNDVWVSEIEGKMMNVNTLSKQDAVALIGAHTVGRVIGFGPWTQQPFFFDNGYFLQLKRVKNWLDDGKSLGAGLGHPFSASIFSDWFQDSLEVEDSHPVMPQMETNIMMLDADLALVLNAPELVEKYAADNKVWRKDFDDAYIVMSELGFASLDPPRAGANRRLLQRSEELLDEDFEFFQNLQISQEEQRKQFHAAFRGKF
jgi:hypothetical protein